ncbi:MAG: signal peptidase I [Clostridia bacterium]|nr:signal peptidase I [Clostridia bacterium]
MENKIETNAAPTDAGAATNKKENKKDVKKIINIVVNVLLIVAIVLAAFSTYISFVSTSGSGIPSIFGISFLSIQTDSMYPTLKPGDLIIDTTIKNNEEVEKLKVGDVITFWTNEQGQLILNTHRITAIYPESINNFTSFQTSGDKAGTADYNNVHAADVVGKWTGMRIPGLGKVVDYLQTSTGFFLLVIIPVLIFFIFHLVQFFRVLFEYQNVKMLIKYEQERGRTEDLIETQIKDEKERDEIRRAAIEAELREKLKAELMADIAKQNATDAENKDENKDKTEQ